MSGNPAKYEKLFLVADSAAGEFALGKVSELYPEGLRAVLTLDPSEQEKTLAGVEEICRWLLEEGADRQSLLIAAGGGVVTDMAGFAASVYMRGIDCLYIPTTLLGMVDAATGGKTGVNLDGYKNIIGSFREPVDTLVDVTALRTLPKEEFLCGAAEMLKTFIICDGGNYRKAVELFARYNSEGLYDEAQLEKLIGEAIKVKRDIVGRDFREAGERKVLNLGHTFAHAIEHESSGAVPHGEAVAMGLVLAAELSERESLAPAGLAAAIAADLEACGLPTGCPYGYDQLRGAVLRDKKASGEGIDFVLVRAIGDVTIKNIKP